MLQRIIVELHRERNHQRERGQLRQKRRTIFERKYGEAEGIERFALLKDAQTLLRIEEVVFSMGQSGTRGIAALEDVQIKFEKEECV